MATFLSVMLDEDGRIQPHAGKALMWSLFAVGEGERDFIWRENSDKSFTVLSKRPPDDRHSMFDILTSEPLDLSVRAGDAVSIRMRCNPVISTNAGDRKQKHDVVMHALTKEGIPKGSRGKVRDRIAHQAVAAWLRRQGSSGGFEVLADALTVVSSRQNSVPRKDAKPLQFTSVDLDARIRIVDREAFLDRVAFGFGSAKAFGCGLMLVAA